MTRGGVAREHRPGEAGRSAPEPVRWTEQQASGEPDTKSATRIMQTEEEGKESTPDLRELGSDERNGWEDGRQRERRCCESERQSVLDVRAGGRHCQLLLRCSARGRRVHDCERSGQVLCSPRDHHAREFGTGCPA
eukprot:1207517-Rhodomonas_salina.2